MREELPRFVAPMLARTGPTPGVDGWVVEVKFDGMRLQMQRDGRAVCLRSRPGRDYTAACRLRSVGDQANWKIESAIRKGDRRLRIYFSPPDRETTALLERGW